MTRPKAQDREPGHLDYYRSQGISPVRYRMASLVEHFDRRDAIYRSLGLPEVAFRGCKVLEVAPGSGQNSLFISQAGVGRYELVEPNPTGIRQIRSVYQEYAEDFPLPVLHETTLESFDADRDFDVVICENWLGSRPAELALITKLASFVAPGGVLVLTMVPYSGFFPNVLRRLLALRILDPAVSFEDQTAYLVEAFGPHLATIADMTRSHVDWVQDCMLNPYYLNVALPFDAVVEAIGPDMEVLGSAPKFASEWRWFKGLVGAARQFNREFARQLSENTHNFVDYREVHPPRAADENARIDASCRALHVDGLAFEANQGGSDARERILGHIQLLANELRPLSSKLGHALDEAAGAWARPHLSAADIAGMGPFAGLFGRETVYLAFTRRRG